jgi:hypothetical protein
LRLGVFGLGLLLAACGSGEDRDPAGAFTDVTDASGVEFTHDAGAHGDFLLPEGIGSGGALFDRDGDGDLDLYLVQGGPLAPDGADPVNRLYRNDGAFRFTDVTEGSGADLGGYGLGCAAADVDGDGDVDLYVTRLGPDVLLRNDGDVFTDATAASGLRNPGFGASAVFLDFDGDGALDLYVTNYVDWAPHLESACHDPRGIRDYCGPLDYDAPSTDRLFRGLGDGTFRDVSEASGIASHRGNGLGVIATDFDGDGRVDLYVANDQTPGFLWLNQGDGTFLEDAALRGCGFNADGLAIAGMGVAAEDLDDDGDWDLVVTNIHDHAHLALRNDAGFFVDATHDWGFGGWGVPHTGFGLALFDQDLDGTLDGFVANGAVSRLAEPYRPDHPFAEPDQFLRRGPDGAFADVTAEQAPDVLRRHEMSRGTLVGDVDDDGDLDLVVTANRGPARLLRNEADVSRAWVTLRILGVHGSAALNTRVRVTTDDGRARFREVRPQAGYLGTNDARVHFGLGGASSITEVEITWPDGGRETWGGLAPRRAYVVRRGQRPEPEPEPEERS